MVNTMCVCVCLCLSVATDEVNTHKPNVSAPSADEIKSQYSPSNPESAGIIQTRSFLFSNQ